MRAFLEKTEKEWMDDFVYLAVEPLKNMGVEIFPFNGINTVGPITRNGLPIAFKDMEFNENDIVIGSVEATDFFFKKLGKEVKYLGYPKTLEPFLGRKIHLTTMGEVETTPFPFFLKPAIDVKLFTGSVCESKKQLDLVYFDKGVTKETPIYVSEPLNFVTEYRCFVHKGKLVGMKHYKGDFVIFPRIELVYEMIEAYTDAPISYTLDVGLIRDEEFQKRFGPYSLKLVVVEVNDFWAIGGYGLDGKTYVRMLIDRFQEIRKS